MCFDLYALSANRGEATIAAFLAAFAARRDEAADGYCVPEYAETPDRVFAQAGQLIEWCCEHPGEEHGIYWHVRDNDDVAHAMVFFLPEGYVVFGVSTPSESPDVHHRLLRSLADCVGADCTLLLWEEPPPDTVEAFREASRRHD